MKIFEPSTPSDLEKYYRLRYEILRKPWNQPEQTTQDEWEDQSVHILIVDENGEAAAAGRLQLNSDDEGQIRSMAVRTDLQQQGLGSKIIRYIEMKAKEKNLKYLLLDSREPAVPFYEKHGYRVLDKSYLLFGVIPHYRMRKDL